MRRYYDPDIGRWTTPDPMGFVDGINLYSYVQNRPLVCVAPNGMRREYLMGANYYLIDKLFYHHYEKGANFIWRTMGMDDDSHVPNYSRPYKVDANYWDHDVDSPTYQARLHQTLLFFIKENSFPSW